MLIYTKYRKTKNKSYDVGAKGELIANQSYIFTSKVGKLFITCKVDSIIMHARYYCI